MNPRNQISDLLEFLQKAIKLAKYNSNTGGGMVNAIKAAERGLLAEEPKDIDYLVSHMEELFFRQKDLGLSPQSQAVYFTRIRRAVEDYKKYGSDAKAIYAWSPKLKPKKAAAANTTKNCSFSCGVEPGSSKLLPSLSAIDQLLCLPLPLMPLNGFSCNKQRSPCFWAVLRNVSISSIL